MSYHITQTALSRQITREIFAAIAGSDLRQYEIEERGGLGKGVLSRLRSHERAMSVGQLDVICREVGIRPSEIVRQAERNLARKKRGSG